MYTSPLGLHMAKLYWRVKKNGKWTWVAATADNTGLMGEYDPEYAAYVYDNPVVLPEE